MSLDWRFDLSWFAYWMAEKLGTPKNEAKASYLSDDTTESYLVDRLKEELDELDTAIDGDVDSEVIGECIDVANFAMMIAGRRRRR